MDSVNYLRFFQNVERIPVGLWVGKLPELMVIGQVPKIIQILKHSNDFVDIPWTAALVRNGFFGFGASKKPYGFYKKLYFIHEIHRFFFLILDTVVEL